MTGEFRQSEMSWGDSGELFDNDVMILEKFFGEIKMPLNDVQLVEMVLENWRIENNLRV